MKTPIHCLTITVVILVFAWLMIERAKADDIYGDNIIYNNSSRNSNIQTINHIKRMLINFTLIQSRWNINIIIHKMIGEVLLKSDSPKLRYHAAIHLNRAVALLRDEGFDPAELTRINLEAAKYCCSSKSFTSSL